MVKVKLLFILEKQIQKKLFFSIRNHRIFMLTALNIFCRKKLSTEMCNEGKNIISLFQLSQTHNALEKFNFLNVD